MTYVMKKYCRDGKGMILCDYSHRMWRAIVLAKIGEQPSGALTRRKMMSSAVMLFFEKI